MKTPELKECPFCLSSARFAYLPSLGHVEVKCTHCGARTPLYHVNCDDENTYLNKLFACIEAAALKWNTRRGEG